MSDLCPEGLGRKFVYSPGGYAPKLPCPICQAQPPLSRAIPSLGKFCHACQAIPIHGYCNIAGCPTGRLRDREFFALDNLVMAASEGGANEIATAQDEEIANTIADALTKAHAPRGDLDVILEWYGGLSVGARQKLSLADLHGLSKRLVADAGGRS